MLIRLLSEHPSLKTHVNKPENLYEDNSTPYTLTASIQVKRGAIFAKENSHEILT